MRLLLSAFVAFGFLLGCGEDDMPLQRQPVSWALTGGLDTKKSPLAIQPGSHLVLDDVVQERLNEWRRRNGLTQSALDTMPDTSPFFVGQLGDRGMFEVGQKPVSGIGVYVPSFTGYRWAVPGAVIAPPAERTRKPLVSSTTTDSAMGRSGNMVIAVGHLSAATPIGPALIDLTGGQTAATLPYDSTTLRFRGAGTSTHVVMFGATSTGNLVATVVDVATGTSSLVTVHAGGGHATSPWLDAFWYGGSTITVVWRTSTNAVRFIEFNPSTGAATTDTTIAGISCANALALFDDPDSSGVRFVASSHTTPTTRVTRVNSAGAVQTDDQLEAIASTQIAGIAQQAGAGWNVIYQTAGGIRQNQKAGGVVGAPVYSPFANATIDSMAWADRAAISNGGFAVILGMHSTNPDDPQDSYLEAFYDASRTAIAYPVSTPFSLAAGAPQQSGLYQVTRTADRRFSMAIPVQVVYEDNAGTIVRHYSIDLLQQSYLLGSDIGSAATQKPVPFRSISFVPGDELYAYDGFAPVRLGTSAPPQIVTGVPSVGAGALTSGAEYGYVALVESLDADGNVWRSPPSAPLLLTLGATENTVQLTWGTWFNVYGTLVNARLIRVSFYRTNANGSSYRRIYSAPYDGINTVTYTDLLADNVADQGEVLYTIGELATAITPSALAIWFYDDRMWVINREYPTEIWYTKNLRPGRQPEFTNEMIVDQDDEFGDATNGAHLDDKSVLFKKNAIYFSQGEGFTDSGSGTNYSFTQISGDVGAIPGSPVVSTGKQIYFVSERGIHSIDQQGNITDHLEVDQFLNQPLVQTKETVLDGCFVPAKNEVRFVTTSYILVHNRTLNYWVRWKLAGFKRCLVLNGQMVLFKSDGTVWREGTETQLTDAGAAFQGTIRSPWMRPAQGATGPATASTATASPASLRIYEGRVTYTRTAGGSTVSLIGRVYRNNDDTQVEEFTSDGLDGSVLSGNGTMKPRDQKCTAFSLELVLPSGDVTVRVDGFSAVVGDRGGPLATDNGNRWRP